MAFCARRAEKDMGKVVLVGAGPGMPDLITVRGVRKLEGADVIFHDSLISAELLDLAPFAIRVNVGKRKGRASANQADICAALIRAAGLGMSVVRLKGGDPMVFARGGEEIESLSRAGVPVEVVPGISAGTGIPALAGIPLTHRDYSSSLTFVSGHDLDVFRSRERFRALIRASETLVVFMAAGGLKQIRTICAEQCPVVDLPAAVIENGASVNQTIHYCSTLTVDEVSPMLGDGPVLCVIGKTVRLSGSVQHQMLEQEMVEENNHEHRIL